MKLEIFGLYIHQAGAKIPLASNYIYQNWNMLIEYRLKKRHNDQLCSIFHQSLNDIELATGKAELAFGDYVIKQIITLSGSYGVWFKGQFIMVIHDLPLHKFSVSVHEHNLLTENMVTIVLECIFTSFKQHYTPPKFNDNDGLINILNDMIATHSEFLTQEDIIDMSELLYSTENGESGAEF